jgi:hypothetical protein
MRRLLFVLCIPVLVLAACGDDDDSGPTTTGADDDTEVTAPGEQDDAGGVDGDAGGDDGGVTGDVLGTIEFTGSTYEFDRVTCDDDQWDFHGPIVYARISLLEDPTLDHDRFNVTLDRDEDGERDPFDDGWENYSVEAQDQPTVEVTDDGITASGVVWPRGSSVDDREDGAEEFVIEARC